MRYPTLTARSAQGLARQLLNDSPIDASAPTQWLGRGEEFDLGQAGSCAKEIGADLQAFREEGASRDLDRFEGQASAKLHRSLAGVPPEVLDDPGFWRFLTIEFYWTFVLWRERSAFESGDFGRYRQYIDGTNPAECVLLRMFLRGQISEERGGYDLASDIPFGADFWRSHILRVRTGSAPIVAQAFVRSHARDRLSTDELRDVARQLNRLWSNVVPYGYEPAEADALIAELRANVRKPESPLP